MEDLKDGIKVGYSNTSNTINAIGMFPGATVKCELLETSNFNSKLMILGVEAIEYLHT